MTMQIDRDGFLAALRKVVDIVPARNTIPALSNVLLECDGGELRVTGNDLDVQASTGTPAQGELAITVDKNKLMAAVATRKPGMLEVEVSEADRSFVIRQGRSRQTLPTLPVSDYPVRPPLEGGTGFKIKVAFLRRLITPTRAVMGKDETRYYFSGVHFHILDGQLCAAACDSIRVVRVLQKVPKGAETLPSIIVPDKAIHQLSKLIEKVECDIAIALNAEGSAISFSFGNTVLLSKLIDAQYPDVLRTIPDEGAHRLVIARDALIEPLNAAAGVINAEGEGVKLKSTVFVLREGEEGCEIVGKDSTGTSAVEPLDGDYAGAPIRFGLNAAYGASVAGIFAESGRLTCSLNAPNLPMRVTSDKDPDLLAAVMPMNA